MFEAIVIDRIYSQMFCLVMKKAIALFPSPAIASTETKIVNVYRVGKGWRWRRSLLLEFGEL